MPSVGMRRTTRVFGVVKGVDSAGVLRSGRRLRQESSNNKQRRVSDSDDWFHHVTKKANSNYATNKKGQHSNISFKSKENEWSRDSRIKKQFAPDHKKVKIETLREHLGDRRKRFGNVYSRKRKRLGLMEEEGFDEKMYAIQFSPRQRRKKQESEEGIIVVHSSPVFVVVGEASSGSQFAYFLNSVLRYMSRVGLVVPELASFLLSEAVSGAFASAGIRFLREFFMHTTRTCKFFGTCGLMPLFSVDFSAIPLCFMHMHFSLVSNFRLLSRIAIYNSDTCQELMSESKVDQSCISKRTEDSEAKNLVHEFDNLTDNALFHPALRSKLGGRTNQYRNVLSSRGVRKRRSSLRRKRARDPSVLGVRKANGALVSDLISSWKKGTPFSSVVYRNKLRSWVHGSTASNLKEVTSTAVGGMDQVEMFCCSANILVVESDKCFRIKGATVMLEPSASGEWIVVVKKDGCTRYTHLAQKIMRPSSANRITHDIIWAGDENWKLEFSNRKDWIIFKDLYKECSDRNVLASSSKIIPVPGVREVFDYAESGDVPFSRPDMYISLNVDEVARAMSKMAANYDMDSEDEEWLKNFNIDFVPEADCNGRLSEDSFELMIDAFEKALYCCPDDLFDDEAALRFCAELGRREIVLAVHEYWMKRRKQKQRALLRVLQENVAIIQEPVLRKGRSFNRQPSQFGRGKQPSLLQVITEEQSAKLKIEEAKLAAKTSVEVAIGKRRQAQLLMQIADLATYRATVALRIAETASVVNSLKDIDSVD